MTALADFPAVQTQPRAYRGPGSPGPGPAAVPEAVPAADRPRTVRDRAKTMRSWPLLVLAVPAAAEVWSGWVGIAQKTGFGLPDVLLERVHAGKLGEQFDVLGEVGEERASVHVLVERLLDGDELLAETVVVNDALLLGGDQGIEVGLARDLLGGLATPVEQNGVTSGEEPVVAQALGDIGRVVEVEVIPAEKGESSSSSFSRVT